MGLGRKLGKTFLAMSRSAKAMSEGFDMVLGEERTRAGDGFSKERSGKRAANFTRKARKSNKAGGIMNRNKDKNLFRGSSNAKEDGIVTGDKDIDVSLGSKSDKDKEDRNFF